jgi:hypothetical protein
MSRDRGLGAPPCARYGLLFGNAVCWEAPWSIARRRRPFFVRRATGLLPAPLPLAAAFPSKRREIRRRGMALGTQRPPQKNGRRCHPGSGIHAQRSPNPPARAGLGPRRQERLHIAPPRYRCSGAQAIFAPATGAQPRSLVKHIRKIQRQRTQRWHVSSARIPSRSAPSPLWPKKI